MKKSILFFAIALFGMTTLSAQVVGPEFVRFGAKGGVNFTNMTSDGFSNNNSRTGFHLGLVAEIPMTAMFSIQPEVLYSTQGNEADFRIAGANVRSEFRLDYIQVPVLAKIHLFQGSALEGLSLEVGPSFNFLVTDEMNYITGSPSPTASDSRFSSFEFGGAVGASFNFPGGFFASARYTQGFTDVFDTSGNVFNSANWDGDAVNNNGWQLGVGFMF